MREIIIHMKKILLSLFVSSVGLAAIAQCTIDPSNTEFFSPAPDSVPCVERTVAYNQVIQISVPSSINLQDYGAPIPLTMYIDSLVITDITGFPTGVDYQPNPTNGVFYGGTNGCILLSGTTTDAAGNYPLTLHGTLTMHGNAFPPFFDGDTTVDLATMQGMSSQFSLSLDVINQGDPCRSTGINDVKFNANISTYPNPAKDKLTLAVNAAERINGTIEIVNMLGAIVAKKEIDIIGSQTFDFNVASLPAGIYALQMKDGNRKYSTTFIKE